MSLNLKKIKPRWEVRLLRGGGYYYVQAEFSSIEGTFTNRELTLKLLAHYGSL